MASKKHSYLALGDSYTIGEGVPVYENFPYQAVQLLRKNGRQFYAPEIVARTGWTTGELQTGINNTSFIPPYDVVSLLIGVNNQYRGLHIKEYENEFEDLLKQAIGFAGNDIHRIFILSIPDWGVTPFAADRDRQAISNEIDAFNTVNKTIAARYEVQYIDITPGSREAAHDESLLTTDQLHPSAKEYARWAGLLAISIQEQIK